MNVAETLHLVTTIDYSKYQYESSCCKFLSRVVVRLPIAVKVQLPLSPGSEAKLPHGEM